ncbi:Hsp20/alpha crystallin family protein [Thauera sp.]|uniref:Hsp20/alpha crystallin family protein n=1 Tax=Thauera sp. TaxID=1905334 RepID=UPI0039E58C06
MSNNLTRRVDPLEDFFRGFFVRPVDFGGGTLASTGGEAPQMRVDVRETNAGYEVHAELPGMKKEDIHVHIDGPVVSISAERKQEKEAKEGEKILRTERYFGKISRSFQFGQEIDEEKASARFNDGVLELSLPKKAEAQAKRLSID